MEIFFSAAALIIAAAALYASTLKRGEIGIGPLGHETAELTAQSWTLPEPKEMKIFMSVFAYNAGARGGFLRNDVSVELKTETDKFFLGRPQISVLPSTRGLPHPMMSGQIDLLGIDIPVKFVGNPSPDSIVRTTELANELRGLPGWEVEFRYSYVGGSSLKPWKRGQPVVKTRTFERSVATNRVYEEIVSQLSKHAPVSD